MVQEHLNILGLKVKDKVTGARGIVSTVSFDLYGCIQAVVVPEVSKAGKGDPGSWYDVSRLQILSRNPVMNHPDFNKGYVAEGKKGPAFKPER